jgi:hypothetical protein
MGSKHRAEEISNSAGDAEIDCSTNLLGLLRRGHNQCLAADDSFPFLIGECGFQSHTVFCVDDFQNLEA